MIWGHLAEKAASLPDLPVALGVVHEFSQLYICCFDFILSLQQILECFVVFFPLAFLANTNCLELITVKPPVFHHELIRLSAEGENEL